MNTTTIVVTKEDKIELFLTWILSLIGVVINIAQLVSIYKTKTRLTNNHVYLISLSLSDLHIALARPILRSLKILEVLQYSSFTLPYLLMTVYNSLLHYLIITIDRLIAVRRPLWYRVKVTKRKCIYSCLLVWVVSFVIAVIRAIVVYLLDQEITESSQYVTCLIIIVCGVAYVVCYGWIVRTVFQRRTMIPGNTTISGEERESSDPTSNRRDISLTKNKLRKRLSFTLSQSELKTMKISASITISYVVLNLPIAISYLHGQAEYQRWLRLLYMLNCSVDSFTYFWLNKSK